MFKKLWKKLAPNPLDRILRKSQKIQHKTFLIVWNRGMGDIALGLYAILHRIKMFIPDARVSFLTRKDLEEPFKLLGGVEEILIDPQMKRSVPYTLPSWLKAYDVILEKADPTYWVSWQRGSLVPKMEWNRDWDFLHTQFELPQTLIGAHVSCETNYYLARNWPISHWEELFYKLQKPIVLFGLKKEPLFQYPFVYDLRGETSLLETLSIIKHRCTALIAPDSGILGLTYFLNTPFKIDVISLWADPAHGILKQNVTSPNTFLRHIPLISPNRKNAALISVDEVLKALC